MEMETKNEHLTENDMLPCYVFLLLLNFTSSCAFWNISGLELRWTSNKMCAECCNGIMTKLKL